MREKQPLPEKTCPECDGSISWKLVLNGWGIPQFNGLCKECNTILRGRELPNITKGKRLEREGITKGIFCMDKRIMSLPSDVQIGILRQRQAEEEKCQKV